MQESCKNLACMARARDMSLFLHNLARLIFLQEMVQDLQEMLQELSNYLQVWSFLHFFARSCKNWCKIVQEKGHIACTCQASLACKILARFLHDLASSFLLGAMMK